MKFLFTIILDTTYATEMREKKNPAVSVRAF